MARPLVPVEDVLNSHFHGFGPWVGSPGEFFREGARRPNSVEFSGSKVPPMQTGHALLRPRLVAATWDDPEAAVGWLREIYAETPPVTREDGRCAYLDADTKAAYAVELLGHRTDVVWAYWLPGQSYAHYSVVCCPNKYLPEIACPTAS